MKERRELMTVTETAQALGMSVRGVLNRLERGQMRGERVHARLWLIPREEVERWKALGRQRPGRKPQKEREEPQ